MARNYIGDVDRINYANTTGSAIASGAPVFPDGYAAGVALVGIAAGATGPVQTRGTVRWTKQPALAIAQGARCFWDAANSRVTTTSGAFLGLAATAAAAGDAEVIVALNEGNAASSLTASSVNKIEAMVSGYGIGIMRSAAAKAASQAVTMSSPPTISVGLADAATTISGGVDVAWNDARLTYQTAVGRVSTFFPDTTLARPTYLDIAADGAAVSLDGRMTGFTFATSATVFEVRAKGFSNHRVWVTEADGVPRALAIQTMASTGNVYRVKYDFGGSRTPRRICVQFDRGIGGVCVPPTDTVMAWAPASPRLAIVGDSITEGTGSGNVLACYAQQLAERLGCYASLIQCGLGGTGWIANTSGSRKNARAIVDSSVIPSAPDVVIWAHGLNDSADVTVNASYCVDAVHDRLPDCVQIMFMPFQPRSVSSVAATRTQMLAVAASRPWLTVIDLTTYGTNPEVTGTGRVGATTGTGNSDWWTSSDTTHPTPDGHAHSASVRDAAIRSALRLS